MNSEFSIEQELKAFRTSTKKYILDLLDEIASGEHNRITNIISSRKAFNLNPKGMNFLLSNIESRNISEQDALMLLKIIPNKNIISYLETKPENQLTSLLVKKVPKSSIDDLFSVIDDDFYKTRLAIQLSTVDLKSRTSILKNIEDLYLRELIYKNFSDEKPDSEKYLEQVNRYEAIQKEFLALETEEKKLNFF